VRSPRTTVKSLTVFAQDLPSSCQTLISSAKRGRRNGGHRACTPLPEVWLKAVHQEGRPYMDGKMLNLPSGDSGGWPKERPL
jgi:hypothetical protein